MESLFGRVIVDWVFVDHVNWAVIGASEKVLLVRAMPVGALASVDSHVDSYADVYADTYADSYLDSPDTTILVPVAWDCNKEIAGYSALVGLCQIERTQQADHQPGSGEHLRDNAAKVHQLGLEQVSLWQVD